jgi:hypothetical protein
MGETCEVFENWDNLAGIPCGEPAIGKYRIGCVHEHVAEHFICAACAAEMQRMDGWICAPCADSAESHSCPLTPEYIWFAAADP